MARINNLGDYGTIWKDLAEFGGSKDAMFQSIRNKAVKDATPGIIAETFVIAIPACLILREYVAKFIKIKKAIDLAKQKESELKEQLETYD